MRSSTLLLSQLLLISSTIGASPENCSEEIKVRSKQFVLAQWGQRLEVKCPVTFCKKPPPLVLWIKNTNESDKDKPRPALESRWEDKKDHSGVSILIFSHVILNDSGEYRCETNYTKGHFINITVTGSAELSAAEGNDTRAERLRLDQLQPYLCSAAGVFLCVVVVVCLSVVSMQRCPGNQRTTPEYQNTVMRMTQHPGPPSDTPLTISPPHRPTENPPTANKTSPHDRLYSNRREEEEEEEDEEDQSVWYAALNHDLMPVAPNLSRGDPMQATEYAAVRVP